MNAARARSLSATFFFAEPSQASSDFTCLHWSGHANDRAGPRPLCDIEWIARA